MSVRFATGVLQTLEWRVRNEWDGRELAYPLFGSDDGRTLLVRQVDRMGYIADDDRGVDRVVPPFASWRARESTALKLCGGVHSHPLGSEVAPSNEDLNAWRKHRARLGCRVYVGVIVGRDNFRSPVVIRAWTVTAAGINTLNLTERTR